MPNRFETRLEDIAELENLFWAAKRVRRRIRSNSRKEDLALSMESVVFDLRDDLLGGTYMPRAYQTMTIFDPKKRRISIPDVRDRILHHGICRHLEPYLERRYIFDSYACRKDKGTLKAIARVQSFSQRFRYRLMMILFFKYLSNYYRKKCNSSSKETPL
ncbi:MAG: hypothetical protein AB8C84_08640 [Oligoflexales bacterium]